MTGDPKKERAALDRLADALVDDILDTPDEDILAETAEDYGDPDKLAADMRALFERTVHEAAKAKLAADLRGAQLRGAQLRGAQLSGADLSGADLRGAQLSVADLRSANLSGAKMNGAKMNGANLSYADLSGANLSGANLSGADLRGAYLIDADLRSANLSGANLSGADGLLDPSLWLAQFPSDDQGIIVYRAQTGPFDSPEHWAFEPGAAIMETPNPDRCNDCGCGVSFATMEWVRTKHPSQPIWKCRIPWRWLPSVVVPLNTDGKARCAFLELLEVV